MKRFVYADNAATTQVSDKVLNAMLPYLKEGYGNPSSVYSKGREAKVALEDARAKVAKAINADPSEVFFTGCGTESDNWAIKGIAKSLFPKGKKHIITTAFEHHAVLHPIETLAKEGFDVTFLSVDENGLITADDVKKALRDDTALVTIMYANNEIGTILPIAEIGAVCRERGVLFHTDAVQAVGNVLIDVKAQNIDMLSLSGHKLHAPKGVGALYVKKGIVLPNFMEGGGQERGKRAGTENLASIVGLGVAIEDLNENLEKHNAHKLAMRDKLINELLKVPHTRLNGDKTHRLPGNVNISFAGVEGEALLLMLDMNGICASSGSACTSGSLDPSHVLMAIGLEHAIAHGSLRLSLGDVNTMEDVDYLIETIPPIIERLRSMSPMWENMMKNENK